MKEISSLLFLAALLLPGLALGGELKPLETWGIKTSDYQKVAKYWSDDDSYKDVPAPNCAKPATPGMKLLCSREDFQKIAWYARRFFIYGEENARRTELNHKKAYAEVYQTKCTTEACLGRELKEDFYRSLEDSGMRYILEDNAD